jgi:hypothetical protein
MGQLGVRIDKSRAKEAHDTPLITPHGTPIVVTASRAAALLARTPIRMGDGTARTYAEPGTDNIVDESVSKAAPPRKGDGRNVPKDGE